MAGYILKAATNSPCNKKTIDLCNPHPIHSKPKSFLLKHGIIKSSGDSIKTLLPLNKFKNINDIYVFKYHKMKFLKMYMPLIIGAIILFTANTENLKKPYLYILGIVLVMYGLFNISKTITNKSDIEENE